MARQTPEGKVKDKIKALLEQYGAWFFMPPGGPYGRAGTPDFICCYRGEFFAIEAKAAGGAATPLQLKTHRKIRDAQGCCFIIYPDTLNVLEEFLSRRRPDAS